MQKREQISRENNFLSNSIVFKGPDSYHQHYTLVHSILVTSRALMGDDASRTIPGKNANRRRRRRCPAMETIKLFAKWNHYLLGQSFAEFSGSSEAVSLI